MNKYADLTTKAATLHIGRDEDGDQFVTITTRGGEESLAFNLAPRQIPLIMADLAGELTDEQEVNARTLYEQTRENGNWGAVINDAQTLIRALAIAQEERSNAEWEMANAPAPVPETVAPETPPGVSFAPSELLGIIARQQEVIERQSAMLESHTSTTPPETTETPQGGCAH